MKSKIVFVLALLTCIFSNLEKVSAYEKYKVGDMVSYNNINFYVIKNSESNEESVTLIKSTPFTVDEVNLYGGVGTNDNHVNEYVTNNSSDSFYKKAYDFNGYGGMAYYSRETCSWKNYTGCTTDYSKSDVKYVIDAWVSDKINEKNLVEDSSGYKARLIMLDDMLDSLAMEIATQQMTYMWLSATEYTPIFVFGNNYDYWTMTQISDNTDKVWKIGNYLNVYGGSVYNTTNSDGILVRPVITLKDSLDMDSIESERHSNEDIKENINGEKNSINKVSVPNTLKSVSGLILLIGLVLVCAGLNIFIILKNRSNKRKK